MGLRILFATAELAPIASVGGLAEAAAGLTRALRRVDVDVVLVVPDYRAVPLHDERVEVLDVPGWLAPMTARRGNADGVGDITLVGGAGLARPHPYVDDQGTGWPDNDRRFAGFSAAVADLARRHRPDVVHLNDWHTALAPGFSGTGVPTVLTIHSLAFQGITGAWLYQRLPHHRDRYEWLGATNALLGAIRVAHRIVTVSPTYARDILRSGPGMGLEAELTARRDVIVGIRNGIDGATWDPRRDPHLVATYGATDRAGKERCRVALQTELGWIPGPASPVIAMITRLVDQKGIDLAIDAARFLGGLDARLVVLGTGERILADRLHDLAARQPERVAFHEGYDAALGHRILAGADLLLMPSRFEPSGLTQMQAMAYGTIPIVTDVGGLHDTVVDADADPVSGNGFVAATADPVAVGDAVHRGVRAWRDVNRRRRIATRGMTTDWSWTEPAARHVELYEALRGVD